MLRTIFYIIFTLVIMVSTTSCSNSNDTANQVYESEAMWARGYSNIEELYSDPYVDLIAVGEIDRAIDVGILETTQLRWGTHNLYYTDFRFKVNQVFKGENVEEIIIHQTGADGKNEIRDDPLFRSGEKYVLFLHKHESGRYSVPGGPQGRYKIVGNEVYSMNYILSPKTYFPPEKLNVDGVSLDQFISDLKK